MLNYIWLGLIVAAVLIGAIHGSLEAVSKEAFDRVEFAVMKLALPLAGIMALWLGVMRLAEKAGLIQILARWLRPVMQRLFPDVPVQHPAMGSMLMNMAANILGLANAATPLGIRAMKDLETLNPRPGVATNAMCTSLAINTSSIQLIPATAVGILAVNGSSNPSAIVVIDEYGGDIQGMGKPGAGVQKNPDVSVIIPSRNEIYLQRTIDGVLENAEADTEVIVILDGYWPHDPIPDHPKVKIIHHTTPVGQRRGVNEGALISQARYVMKLDAHCAVDKGFDAKLIKDCTDDDTTVIPRMYNLHAFDWVCDSCGHRKYQSPTPAECEKCKAPSPRKEMIWKPRITRRTDFMRFDSAMCFQYWREYERRPESKGDICDLMSSVGACFFMTRRRLRRLGYMDERHGSWGQFGTEIACKRWLSGGRQVVNKKTYFSHMFRTQGGDFGFPYQISGNAQQRARVYSRWLWKEDNWKGPVRKLSWLIEKFSPVPTW